MLTQESVAQFWKKGDDFSDLDLGNDDFSMGGIEKGTDAGLPPMGDVRTGLSQDTSMDEQPKLNPSNYAIPPAQSANAPPQQAYQQMYSAPQVSSGNNRDFELLSSKLDAMKASLENINQRLANLERMAAESETGPRRRANW